MQVLKRGCKPLEATQPSNPPTPNPSTPPSTQRQEAMLTWRCLRKALLESDRHEIEVPLPSLVGWFQWSVGWVKIGGEGGGYPIRKVWLGSDDFPLRSLGDVSGFSYFLGVVSGDYGKPWITKKGAMKKNLVNWVV